MDEIINEFRAVNTRFLSATSENIHIKQSLLKQRIDGFLNNLHEPNVDIEKIFENFQNTLTALARISVRKATYGFSATRGKEHLKSIRKQSKIEDLFLGYSNELRRLKDKLIQRRNEEEEINNLADSITNTLHIPTHNNTINTRATNNIESGNNQNHNRENHSFDTDIHMGI